MKIFTIIGIIISMMFSTDAKSSDVDIFSTAITFQKTNVNSINDLRFSRIVKQKYDYSCGSAALATLLTYHYGIDTAEEKAVKFMYENGEQEKIKKEGFSMLDMKKYLQSKNLKANGYKSPLDSLIKVKIPAIALINARGYMHFVVIKGVANDKVLYGDPALGMKVADRKDFEEMWNGILFIINDEKSQKYADFNAKKDWKNRSALPLAYALDDAALSGFSVHTAFSPNYF